jgi:hypothetical protein
LSALNEYSLGGYRFEAQIHCASDTPRAMNDPGGDNNALPRPKRQRETVGQLDFEFTLHDKEEFIGARMLVPRIVSSDNSQTKTARVDPADDLVSVRVGHCGRLTGEVYHHKRWKTHGLAGVGFGRRDWKRHWRPDAG